MNLDDRITGLMESWISGRGCDGMASVYPAIHLSINPGIQPIHG
jgi:hypothetical protein